MRVKFGFSGNPNLLVYHGPTFSVNIGFDKSWRAASKTPPNARGYQLDALVDTGAQDNCIDRMLANQLGLPIVDRQAVCGVHGVDDVDFYTAQIYVPVLDHTEYGRFAGVKLKEGGHRQHVLLGRTFLSHFKLTYDGSSGEVVVEA